MKTGFLLVTASAQFLLGCTTIQSPVARTISENCVLTQGENETKEIVALNNQHRSTLIYIRADWAAAGIFNNDTYVPSRKFFETLGDSRCVIADVTKSGSNELIKRFGSDGIPFFVLLDSEGKKISILRWGRDFDEFKIWFDSVKPSGSY